MGKASEGEEGGEEVAPAGELTHRCRDVPFCVAFLAFWVGMVAVAAIGFRDGDPRVLVFGHDYTGGLCDEGDTDGFKFRYWVNMRELFYVASDAVDALTIDASDFGFDDSAAGLDVSDTTSICLKSCPEPASGSSVAWVCEYPDSNITYTNTALDWTYADWESKNYSYFSLLKTEYQRSSYQWKGPCWPVLFHTEGKYWSCQYVKSGGSYAADATTTQWSSDCRAALSDTDSNCVIDATTFTSLIDAVKDAVNDLLGSAVAVMDRYIDDLAEAWRVLVICGAVAPMAIGFLWLVIMRYATTCFAWLIVLVVNGMAWVCTIFFAVKAGWVGDSALSSLTGDDSEDDYGDEEATSQNLTAMKVFCVLSAIASVLLFLFTLLMARRIVIASAVMKVATQAIAHVPTVLLFPIVPFIWAMCLLVWWVFGALYLFSAGDTVERDECYSNGRFDTIKKFCHTPEDRTTCNCGYETNLDKTLQYMLLYHLFGLLWTAQFIIGFSYTTIAMVVSEFYWKRGEGKLVDAPVPRAMKNTLVYHLGSIALGAFIVAVIQFIRLIIKYIESKCKELKEKNTLVKFAFCCVNCCLACVECVMKYINRNAYIMVAVEGKGYCASAIRAITLIMNNILRVAAVNMIGDLILFLGKLAIALGSGALAFLMLEDEAYKTGEHKVSSPLLIVILCIFAGYLIASVFMAVVEMAIDTVLLAFCLDCEKHGGNPAFAPPLLMDAMGTADDFRKKEAERKAARASSRAEHEAAKAARAQENAQL